MPTEESAASDPKPKTWFEWVSTTSAGITALFGAIAALIAAAVPIYNGLFTTPDPKRSSICQFTDGWIDYKPLPGAAVGTECNDQSGGFGQTVAKGSGPRIQVSTVCQFFDGWHNYSGITPGRIGVFCHDEMGKVGRIVATGAGQEL